jgi:hypothetical protein
MSPIKAAIVAAVLLVAGPSGSLADYPHECALRDVQLVTQLEQQGEAQAVAGDILYEAFWTMMRARHACAEGRVSAGLALYDSIFKQSLAGRAQ